MQTLILSSFTGARGTSANNQRVILFPFRPSWKRALGAHRKKELLAGSQIPAWILVHMPRLLRHMSGWQECNRCMKWLSASILFCERKKITISKSEIQTLILSSRRPAGGRAAIMNCSRARKSKSGSWSTCLASLRHMSGWQECNQCAKWADGFRSLGSERKSPYQYLKYKL